MNWQDLKKNHKYLMILCCVVPILLLFAGIGIFGINSKYLFWFILLLCPLMHLWMMKDMHKGSQEENEDEEGEEGMEKKKKGCH